jgi:hypothetical protein
MWWKIWCGHSMMDYMVLHDLMVKVQLDHGGEKVYFPILNATHRLLLLYIQSRMNKCCLTIRGRGNKVGRKGNLELRVCVGSVYNGQVSLLLWWSSFLRTVGLLKLTNAITGYAYRNFVSRFDFGPSFIIGSV